MHLSNAFGAHMGFCSLTFTPIMLLSMLYSETKLIQVLTYVENFVRGVSKLS
jgi:hypothetical protein